MSRYRSDPEMAENLEPSACRSFLHYTWKAITCLFSHVTLVTMVVSYCILGAITFRTLEKEHELEVSTYRFTKKKKIPKPDLSLRSKGT